MRYSGTLAALPTPTNSVLRDLPPGFETRVTLRLMRDLVHGALAASDQTARLTAIAIVKNAGISARDWLGEVRALQTWVRDNIRFTRDPDTFELLQTPEKTLEIGAGDCDDQATLLASMLVALGHPAQFIAVGFDGAPFSHVLVRTKIGDTWVPAETILPGVTVGWWPDGVTSSYILKI